MVDLPSDVASALEILLEELNGTAIPWALTGSTSFALQGVPIDPDDIDVQTTKSGAYAIEERFTANMVTPLSFSETAKIRSYFGTLELNGVPVEIMGELQKRSEGEGWEPPVDVTEHRQFVLFRGYKVPVLSLAYEAYAYDQLGRTERANMLREHGNSFSES